MEIFTLIDLDDDDRRIILNYFKINKRFIDFGNDCKPQTMVDLFGEKRGNKLWEHFVLDCQRDPTKWLTYITRDERDTFWVQILKYEYLTKGILDE